MGVSTSYSKAETEIRDKKLKQLFGSGVHPQPLKITDAIPTDTGGYFLKDVGTYPNGLITEDGNLNIGLFDGNTWDIVKISLGGVQNISIPKLEITDSLGKIAFKIDDKGQTSVAKFHKNTISKLKASILNSVDISIDFFAVLGDSISTTNGGGSAGLTEGQVWWAKLSEKLGAQSYVNAIAGSCIATGGEPTEDFSSDNRLNAIIASSPKVVFIFGGINDFGQDIPLGTFGSTDNTNFHGALRYVYTKLMTGLPNARIIHMTPLHMNYVAYSTIKPEYNGQNYLSDYIAAIKQEAQAFGVSVIDTNQNSGITQYNIDSYASDRIHGDASFHELIFKCVLRELKNLL